MWSVKSAREPVYTVFKNPTTKEMMMKTEKNLSAPSESKGICAAIAKLMRRRSVIDIVERFQAKHALQGERETKNFHPSTNGAVAAGIIRLTE
jgi:1,2-phenylacetyl-CoA epoxidase PaaB subunit